MTALTLRQVVTAPGAVLVVLAALNGWVARLIAPDAPAVSLFAGLTLWICLHAVAAGADRPLPRWLLAPAVALILVPSGTAAWCAVLLLAPVVVRSLVPRALLIGLALTELLTVAGMPRIKGTLLPFEAAAAGGMLDIAGLAPEISGNVIALSGRMTVVAVGCSGLPGALFAALGALSLFFWRNRHAPAAVQAMILASAAALAFAVNLLRLALMATDETLYAIAHGQYGALGADLAASGAVLLVVLLAERAGPR